MAKFNIENPDTRKWLYKIAAAGLPLLVGLHLLAPEDVQLWLALVEAVLGTGVGALAVINTPSKDDENV